VTEHGVDPVELFMAYLDTNLAPEDAPSGTVIGPATDTQQMGGVVQLMAAGMPQLERYTPTLWQRVQIRCVAKTLEEAQHIALRVLATARGRNRVVVTQPSDGHEYLIHSMELTAGPSGHFDTPKTFEALIFAEIMVGTQPVS